MGQLALFFLHFESDILLKLYFIHFIHLQFTGSYFTFSLLVFKLVTNPGVSCLLCPAFSLCVWLVAGVVCVCVWGVLYGASWLAVGATGCSRRTWLLSAAANHCVVFKWTFVISLVCHEFTVLFSGGCLWEDFISSIYDNKTWYFFVETWPLLTLIES